MEDEKILEIEFVVDYQTYKNYVLTAIKSRKAFLAYLSFLFLSGIAALFFGVKFNNALALVGAFFIVFPVCLLLMLLMSATKRYNKNPLIKTTKNKLRFCKNYIYYNCKNQLKNSVSTLDYKIFKSVTETQIGFYLITFEQTGIFIGKNIFLLKI